MFNGKTHELSMAMALIAMLIYQRVHWLVAQSLLQKNFTELVLLWSWNCWRICEVSASRAVFTTFFTWRTFICYIQTLDISSSLPWDRPCMMCATFDHKGLKASWLKQKYCLVVTGTWIFFFSRNSWESNNHPNLIFFRGVLSTTNQKDIWGFHLGTSDLLIPGSM